PQRRRPEGRPQPATGPAPRPAARHGPRPPRPAPVRPAGPLRRRAGGPRRGAPEVGRLPARPPNPVLPLAAADRLAAHRQAARAPPLPQARRRPRAAPALAGGLRGASPATAVGVRHRPLPAAAARGGAAPGAGGAVPAERGGPGGTGAEAPGAPVA